MIKIRNKFTGEVILERETLQGANLREADLQGANLREADLREADLREADLREADLQGANLREADLREADLWGAGLWSALGNRKEVKSIHIFEEYDIAYTATHLQIGCEHHAIEQWWGFDDARIIDMDGDTALLFWQRNKQLIKQIIETNPAKPTGVKDNESK